MYDKLLKFCQPLINSRVMSEKENPTDYFFRCNFHDAMINSLSPVRRSVFYLLRTVLSLSAAGKLVSSMCRTMYTQVTRSGVTRRTGATTNLFTASLRCISTMFRNWFHVMLCQNLSMGMRCLAENDGIGTRRFDYTFLSSSILFSFFSPRSSPDRRCCVDIDCTRKIVFFLCIIITTDIC